MLDSTELLTRRRLLDFAATGPLGLSLAGLWQAQAAASAPSAPRFGTKTIRACILVFYYGGPSHIDTYDMKPKAPAEVRGEFKPISTTVPGVQICEHLPRMAHLMNKVALVRSVHHQARLHDSASIHALTGRPLDGPDRELFAPLPQFYPSFGSAVASAGGRPAGDVPFASLPYSFRNVHEVPCQGGGILGSGVDPLLIEVDAGMSRYRAELLKRTPELPSGRLRERHNLLGALESRLDRHSPFRDLYQKAYTLLDSEAIRRALDVSAEPDKVRERYRLRGGACLGGRGRWRRQRG